MKQIYHFSLLGFISTILLLFSSSCGQSGVGSDGVPRNQASILFTLQDGKPALAAPYALQSFDLDAAKPLVGTKEVAVGLAFPEESDTKVSLALASEKGLEYVPNSEAKTLPESCLTFPHEVTIPAGSTLSDAIKIELDANSGELSTDQVYVFAIELQATPGTIVPMEPNNLLVYTVQVTEESVEITKTVRLKRDSYFDLAKGFSYDGSDVTLEGLLCVEQFRPGMDISTFMGIEGGLLLRFGDVGKNQPANKLQANGENVNLAFDTKRWYHIACVCQGMSTKVYINGKEYLSFRQGGKLVGRNPFYIGKSWDNNRGILARMSELRVWSVARTKEEINDSMYSVDPGTSGLLAYWKMDSAEGTTVRDRTGHGYDLKLRGSSPSVEVFTEDTPIEVEPLD